MPDRPVEQNVVIEIFCDIQILVFMNHASNGVHDFAEREFAHFARLAVEQFNLRASRPRCRDFEPQEFNESLLMVVRGHIFATE